MENQLLVGEIEVLTNGEMHAILSTVSTASVRDAISIIKRILLTNRSIVFPGLIRFINM